MRPDQRGDEGNQMSLRFWVCMEQDLRGKDGGDMGNHAHGLHPTRLEKWGERENCVSRRKKEEEEGRGGEEGQTTSPPRCGAEGFLFLC
ncbi:hypothetical protein ACE6H2_023764 [Prunus campanulata]